MATAGDLAPLNNPDGVLNAADVLILQRMITGAILPTPTQTRIGDVAPLGMPDNALNAGDVVVLMRAVNGEVTLPDVYIGPDAPVLDPAASPTNVNPLAISGTAEPNTEIRLHVNGALAYTTLSSASGTFMFDAVLNDGLNTLYATATSGGIDSDASNVLAIDYQNQQERAYDDTSIAGTVVWSPGITPEPYVVEGTLTIPLGAELIVQPGTEIRLGFGARLNVLGDLVIQGTALAPVVLTSGSPDPRRGDWLGVIVESTAGRVLIDHALIQWAANGVAIYGGLDVRVSNSTIVDSDNAGIYVTNGATPRIDGNVIDQWASNGYGGFVGNGIEIDSASPHITNNFIRNHSQGIFVRNQSSPVIEDGNTIDGNNFGIYLLGDYTYPENNPSPVIRQNSILNNSTVGVAADSWVTALPISDDYAFLLEIELDISNNWWGSGNPSAVSASVAAYNANGPVLKVVPFLDAAGGVPVPGNYLNGLSTTNLQLSTDVPYTVVGDFVIARNATQTINAGTTLLFARGSAVTALGALWALGNAGTPITLDSVEAVKAAGDWRGISLYGDNSLINHAVIRHAVSPVYIFGRNAEISHSVISDFSVEGVRVYSGATADIRYNQFTGSSRTGWGLSLASSEVTVAQNAIAQTDSGIYISRSSPTIQGNDISDNNRGIYIQNTATTPASPLINADNSIYANDYGIYLYGRRQIDTDPAPQIHDNRIYSNTQYNLYLTNFNAASIIEAANNGWGSAVEADVRAGFNDPYHVRYSPFKDADGNPVTATGLTGVISESRVLAGGQTHLVDTMIVDQGVSLTVEAGARLEFPDGAQLVVNGELILNGTPASPVVFTRAAGASSWNGIYLNAPNALLHDFVIEHARESLHVVTGPVSVYDAEFRHCLVKCVFFEGQFGSRLTLDVRRVAIDAGGPTIDGMVIFHGRGAVAGSRITNAREGLYLYGTNYELAVAKSHFADNVHGVSVTGNYSPNTPAVNDSNFAGNTERNYWTASFDRQPDAQLDATTNWWGTIVDSEIQASIWDEEDVASNMPKVNYLPYRTEPVPMPPALDSLPALHSDGTLAVTGQAGPSQNIRVYVNGGSAGSGVADGTGAFSIPVALPAGTNDIHAVSYSGTTESYPSRTGQVVRDIEAPVITLTAPAEGLLTNQYAMTFSGSISEPATLTIDGNAVILNPDNTFAYGPVYLSEGANAIELVATDSAGNVTTQTLNLTLDSTPPAAPDMGLISFGPLTGGSVTVTGGPDAAEPGVVLYLTNARTGEAVRLTVQSDGSFSASIAAGAGDDLGLVVSDALGNQAPWHSETVAGSPAALAIVSVEPTDGAVIAGNRATVIGTWSGPANTGITVNGQVAEVYGDRFLADGILLEPGANTVTVTATTVDGTTVTHTQSLTRSGDTPFTLTAEPLTFSPPFVARVTLSLAAPMQSVSIDQDGDGGTDWSATNLGATQQVVDLTYAVAGLHVGVVHAVDGSGTPYDIPFGVVLEDAQGTQARRRSVYQQMLDRLGQSDTTGALRYFDSSTRSRYSEIFSSLGAELPALSTQLRNIQGTVIGNRFSEFSVIVDRDGVAETYLIYLLRGGDGVWRVYDM